MTSLVLALALLGAQDLKAAPRGLDIYFIDVDGGAATLLVTPEGKTVLIDSGWPGKDDRDPKRIVHVIKDLAKLDTLDHVVTTHWHMDHFGGVEGLEKLIPVGQYWDRGLPEDKIGGLDFPDGPKDDDPLGIAYRKASKGKRKALKVGDNLPLGDKLSALVVASGGKVLGEGVTGEFPANPACEQAPVDKPVDGSDNARSLAFLIRLGEFGFLDCGDLTWNIEKKLVCPTNRLGQVDLFQVTHHGMDISNHPTLLKTIEPTVAIMDNGSKKGGSPATVKLMKSLPSIKGFYALHKNASTNADDNADSSKIANANPAGGEFIKVSVSPDGSSFEVTIGEHGKPERFKTR